MKEYGCFQAMYMSFYSRRLYRDVAKNWGIGVVFYLFVLLALCWIAMMFKIQPVINTSFKSFANQIAPQVPEITIVNGIASTPEKKPYFIKDPDKNTVFAIIDTSGQYKDISSAPQGTVLLMTSTTLTFVDKSDTRIVKFPTTLNMDIKPEVVKTKMIHFVGWGWVLILPFMILVSLIYRLIQALIYAVFGLIFVATTGARLTYGETVKLSMIAVTPAIILGTVLSWFDIAFHFQMLLYFVLAMVYLFFAVKSNKN